MFHIIAVSSSLLYNSKLRQLQITGYLPAITGRQGIFGIRVFSVSLPKPNKSETMKMRNIKVPLVLLLFL